MNKDPAQTFPELCRDLKGLFLYDSCCKNQNLMGTEGV